MARGDLITSTFGDVQQVLQLALIACNQESDRVLAALIGSIVALVGNDPLRVQVLERAERSLLLAREMYARRPMPVMS